MPSAPTIIRRRPAITSTIHVPIPSATRRCLPVMPWSIKAWSPSPRRKSNTTSAAEVKRIGPGVVVSRQEDRRIAVAIGTTEDVFLRLGHRSADPPRQDLDKIERGRPAAAIGTDCSPSSTSPTQAQRRPTYRLISQMEGQHGYLRRDAARAGEGNGWKAACQLKPAEDHAAVEIWLTIDGARRCAVCGCRIGLCVTGRTSWNIGRRRYGRRWRRRWFASPEFSLLASSSI